MTVLPSMRRPPIDLSDDHAFGLFFQLWDVQAEDRRGSKVDLIIEYLRRSYVRGEMTLARFEESVDGLVRYGHRLYWTSDVVAIIPLGASEASAFPILIGGVGE